MQSMQSLNSAILLLIFVRIDGQSKLKTTCGLLRQHNSLIINAFSTNQWPWHAAIYHRGDKPDPEYQCGGTLINSNSVLTAAHCIFTSNGPIEHSKISISLGKTILDANESFAQDFEVIFESFL